MVNQISQLFRNGLRGSAINMTIANGATSRQSDFFQQRLELCERDKAIAPDVFAANVVPLGRQEIYESLNWHIPNQAGWMRPTSWWEGVGYQGEDGEIWQVRLDVPLLDKKGKPRKYEGRKGGGARVFRPNVPPRIRQLISERYKVAVPLTDSFWLWMQSHEARGIPVLLTEGGDKALSALSEGIPAIALYGCNAAFEAGDRDEPRRLLTAIAVLATRRQILIGFDSDEKPKTRARVRAATTILGKKLGANPDVRVVTWPHELGKGIDDLHAAQGPAMLHQVLAEAVPFRQWRKDSLTAWAGDVTAKLGARATADFTANAPRIGDCGFPLPALGEALLIDGPMGSGKTHWMGLVQKDLAGPGVKVVAIGHRNNLLRQTGSRLGLHHIADLAGGDNIHGIPSLGRAGAIAYCVDSLRRHYDAMMRHIAEGGRVLLLLDEVDALIRHLLLAETISPVRRITMLYQFSNLLQAIARGGGWIIGGEAQLSQLAVDALRRLSLGSLSVKVGRSLCPPAPWDCLDVELGPVRSPIKAKAAALAIALKHLDAGDRVLLLCSSQKAAEELDEICQALGFGTIRIDSKTSADPYCRELLQNPGGVLAESPAKILIGSPSIESGISIEGDDLFDAVVLLATSLNAAAAYQQLGRYRNPNVPRYLCVSDRAAGGSTNLDPDEILNRWHTSLDEALAEHQLTIEARPEVAIAEELAADYLARGNASQLLLHDNLIAKLQADGHQIRPYLPEFEGQEGRLLGEATDIVLTKRTRDWLRAEDQALTPEQARTKLRNSELGWGDRVQALKAVARDRYGDLVDKIDWVEAYWTNPRASQVRKRAMDSAAERATPGMATERDHRDLQTQIDLTGTAWAPSFVNRARAQRLLAKLPIEDLLAQPLLHKANWAVLQFFRRSLILSAEIEEVFGLRVTRESEPIAFINDLLVRRIGFEVERKRETLYWDSLCDHQKSQEDILEIFRDHAGNIRPKIVVWAYRIVESPFRAEMIAAIQAEHARYKDPPPRERQVPPPEPLHPETAAMASMALTQPLSTVELEDSIWDIFSRWVPRHHVRELAIALSPAARMVVGDRWRDFAAP